MPIYEFCCPECGEKAEVIQKFDDPPPICRHEKNENKIPESNMVRKTVSKGTGFVLKGSGWFRDGYSSKKK